ncbi:hypothetical protein [Allobaculum sp. JKK-2023]|uniref:hypothetical protein n=1 Tax=Allobaculum sp. JKK-2023 TaxID=3108943 RepID=UPI002B0581D1|nr:hypothetical protein [Allobaculum sp. JKK-2023]
MTSTEIETSIAQGLRSTEYKARYDAACKRLLSEKVILAHILKAFAKEYKDSSTDDIANKYIEGKTMISRFSSEPDTVPPLITGIDTVQKNENRLGIVYDLLFQALVPDSEDHVELIINIEAQNEPNPGYPLPKRSIYYTSEKIADQKGRVFTKDHYEKIRKVYSIWICQNQPEYRANNVTHLHMACDSFVGDYQERECDYDLLSIFMVYLGGSEGDGKYKGILRLLDVLLSNKKSAVEKGNILKNEFGIPMTESMEKEFNNMCNLGEAIEQNGIQKGIKKGRHTTRLEDIQAIRKNLGYSLEQAMDLLNVPDDERSEYLTLLQERLEA